MMNPFLDSLPHAVDVERLRLAARSGASKQLQRLTLRVRREREERDVGLRAARLDHRVQPVFPVLGILATCVLRPRAEDLLHLARALSRTGWSAPRPTITA